jgi:hypothetical protein
MRRATAELASDLRLKTEKGITMAATPSKDYKRREREQRKLDKRMARDAAKDGEIEAQRIADEEALKLTDEYIQAKLEADFEAELEAERESQKVA